MEERIAAGCSSPWSSFQKSTSVLILKLSSCISSSKKRMDFHLLSARNAFLPKKTVIGKKGGEDTEEDITHHPFKKMEEESPQAISPWTMYEENKITGRKQTF